MTAEEMRERAAKMAERTEIFPMPRNRIVVENVRHIIAAAIRAIPIERTDKEEQR